jgi:hypothetical protein
LLYKGIGQFPLELCVPLSKALVLGGSIANLLVLALEKHPLNDKRPIIYYEVAAYFEPPGKFLYKSVLLGTTIGVFLNTIFPNWLIIICMIFVVSLMTIRVIYK